MSITPLQVTDDGALSLTKINDNFDDLDNRVPTPGGSDTQLQFNNDGVFAGARLAYTQSGNDSIITHTGTRYLELISGADEFYLGNKAAGFGADGYKSFFQITDNSASLYGDLTSIGRQSISKRADSIVFYTNTGEYTFSNNSESSDFGTLDFSDVTGVKTFTFPNKTGEVGLIEDKTTFVELAVNNNGNSSTIYSQKTSEGAGMYVESSGGSYFWFDAKDNNSLCEIYDDGVGSQFNVVFTGSDRGIRYRHSTSNTTGRLSFQEITGTNKTFTFPNATGNVAVSSGTTGGTGSAGAGNQYVELNIGGTVYKLLHDGTV
jgi:hypothetical protein